MEQSAWLHSQVPPSPFFKFSQLQYVAKTGMHKSGAPYDQVDYVSYGGAKYVWAFRVKLSPFRPPNNQNL